MPNRLFQAVAMTNESPELSTDAHSTPDATVVDKMTANSQTLISLHTGQPVCPRAFRHLNQDVFSDGRAESTVSRRVPSTVNSTEAALPTARKTADKTPRTIKTIITARPSSSVGFKSVILRPKTSFEKDAQPFSRRCKSAASSANSCRRTQMTNIRQVHSADDLGCLGSVEYKEPVRTIPTPKDPDERQVIDKCKRWVDSLPERFSGMSNVISLPDISYKESKR